MRLLNTHGLRFAEFYDYQVPSYAILSHRWSGDDVSYSDYIFGPKKDIVGYVKIVEACNLVAEYYDYDWIWIDTCCINKDSSAELSEAINSMFQWYYNAELCLAYLHDVSSKPDETTGPQYEAFLLEFRNSDWFTRGWTLQELLAPAELVFVSNQWQPIDTKRGCATVIRDITNIDCNAILRYRDFPYETSVACKMSWASGRRTSRVEDEAYCLLGLFRINMPLLYGEGRRAFRRLQEEVVRTVDDESIFAWDIDLKYSVYEVSGNLFAQSVSNFSHCGNIIKALHDERKPYSMTNRGLQIDTILFPVDHSSLYIIQLNCSIRDCENSMAPLALHVVRDKEQDNTFKRWECTMIPTGLESLLHSGATHQRSVVFLQTNAFENNLLASMNELDIKEARFNRKKAEVARLLSKLNKGLVKWTDIEPRDLHSLSECKKTEMCTQILRECEKTWGVEHTFTLGMIYKLGDFYAFEDMMTEAMEMYTRAHQGYEKIEGRDHPSTRKSPGRYKACMDQNARKA